MSSKAIIKYSPWEEEIERIIKKEEKIVTITITALHWRFYKNCSCTHDCECSPYMITPSIFYS